MRSSLVRAGPLVRIGRDRLRGAARTEFGAGRVAHDGHIIIFRSPVPGSRATKRRTPQRRGVHRVLRHRRDQARSSRTAETAQRQRLRTPQVTEAWRVRVEEVVDWGLGRRP